jgi:hypothetical protein
MSTGEFKSPDNSFYLWKRLLILLLKKNKNSIVNGKKIGKLLNLIITNMEKGAEVTHAIISRPFCYLSLMVRDNVISLSEKNITIYLDNVEK